MEGVLQVQLGTERIEMRRKGADEKLQEETKDEW